MLPKPLQEIFTDIRPATLAEAPKITDLLTQLGYPDTKEFIRKKIVALTSHPESDLAVGVEGKDVLGFISIHFIPKVGRAVLGRPSVYMCVDASSRGRGIGRRLEEYCEHLPASGAGTASKFMATVAGSGRINSASGRVTRNQALWGAQCLQINGLGTK